MINLNDTQPVSPANAQNVLWQSDSSGNVSASIVFVAPNVTTVQKLAIVSPPAGMLVYDTTLLKLCVYANSAWETVTSV